MGYLLFVFYTILLCWLITRLRFFRNCGLSSKVLIILFLIRVLVGLVNGYISLYYYPVADAREFHMQGITEFDLLFNKPYEYLTNIFRTNYNNYSNFFESSDSFWNDLRTNIIAKILSIFDIFSGKNFFINTLFFNFLIFFGAIYFYKIFIKFMPKYSFVIIICVFLLPSVIYFTSGIHRDGFIFLCLSIVIYNTQKLIEQKKHLSGIIFPMLIFLCIILLLRNFVFIALAPALLAWLLAERFQKHAFISFLGVYGAAAVLFFFSTTLPPAFNLPEHVVSKQLEFIELSKGGGSAIAINPLHANIGSFLHNAPQALNHSIMRPYLNEKFNFLYTPLAVEILAYEVLFLLFVFFRKKTPLTPFIYFCLFFSISMFLVIGYTIPILGAIVRYRSIYFPLLLIPIIYLTDWEKIKAQFYIIKK